MFICKQLKCLPTRGSCLQEFYKVFVWKIPQNSQENTCARVCLFLIQLQASSLQLFSKRDSSWILRIFQEHLFVKHLCANCLCNTRTCAQQYLNYHFQIFFADAPRFTTFLLFQIMLKGGRGSKQFWKTFNVIVVTVLRPEF